MDRRGAVRRGQCPNPRLHRRSFVVTHELAGPTLRDLFDESITERQLIDALRSLRVPRHLFKFMYRLLVAHCNAHTEEDPVWQITAPMFESTLSLYRRDQDAFDRGVGAV